MLLIITIIIILLLYSIWKLGTRNFGYWKEKGIKYDQPVFFFGNLYKQIIQTSSVSELLAEVHERFPEEKYFGVHVANDLGLMLLDPELIKHVLANDFQHFHKRGVIPHRRIKEPLLQNLFLADGDVWKLMRQRLTPAFSSGKLKAMFPLIVRTAEKMLSVNDPGQKDAKDLMARYTTDFIGTCGFGLELDSLNDETSMFRQLGKRIFTVTKRDAIIYLLKRVAPDLFKKFHFFAPEVEDNTISIVKEILKKRNYQPSGRNDYVDLLLEIKQKGKIVGQSIEDFYPDGTAKSVELEMDDLMITAQVFIFFAAGFETSSGASSCLLHELAFNPEVQERCQHEVDEVLSRYGGKISYEAVKEMKYLEMALKETLRLYPSPGFLVRRCGKKYTFPGTELTIDEDVYIIISLLGLHKNPKLFADPETFNPDRFSPERVDGIPKYAYMPFGEGPRACIGERLGILQSLTGVSAILSKFTVKPAPTSRRHPLIDPQSVFAQNVKGGLPLLFELRNKL